MCENAKAILSFDIWLTRLGVIYWKSCCCFPSEVVSRLIEEVVQCSHLIGCAIKPLLCLCKKRRSRQASFGESVASYFFASIVGQALMNRKWASSLIARRATMMRFWSCLGLGWLLARRTKSELASLSVRRAPMKEFWGIVLSLIWIASHACLDML